MAEGEMILVDSAPHVPDSPATITWGKTRVKPKEMKRAKSQTWYQAA